MVYNPQDEMLRRRLGGLGGLMFGGATPTEQRRVGALGMYIPAPRTTTGASFPVGQGIWGQSPADVTNRAVGSPGIGETSAIPSQITPGIGEEAWRTPTGNIVTQQQVEQAMPSVPTVDVGGQRGTEEVRGLAQVISKAPTEPPQTPASVGSSAAPAPVTPTQQPSPYQPTAAPSTPTPSPRQMVEVGRGESSYMAPVTPTPSLPVGRNGGSSYHGSGYSGGGGGLLSGFGRRSGGLWGLISNIIGDIFGGRR
jgi:hypothetical protein